MKQVTGQKAPIHEPVAANSTYIALFSVVAIENEARELYEDPTNDWWKGLVVPVVKEMVRRDLIQVTGLSAREIHRICNGKVTPLPAIREKLLRAAAEYARGQLEPDAPADDLAACAAYLDQLQRLVDRGHAA